MARSKYWLLLVLVLVPSYVSMIPFQAAAQVPTDQTVTSNTVQAAIATTTFGNVRSGYLSVVSEFQLSLAAGEVLTIETVNISEGGDPVLHLLNAQTGEELAVNNSFDGGVAARIDFTASANLNVILVVRSLFQESAGTADLLKNGQSWKTAVPFAGWHQPYAELLPGEQLRTVHQPNGTGSVHRMYIISSDQISMEMRVVGGGPDGAAVARFSDGFGKPDVIIGVPAPEAAEQILLIHNDLNNDADGDGLGNRLEAAIGTCSTLSGFVSVNGGYEFDCSLASDPRDTDGDGISDGVEVFGLRVLPEIATATADSSSLSVVLPDVVAAFETHLNLPKWGADPRHKDLFIEIDFMQRMPGETPQKLSPAVARQFAGYYGDTLDNPIPLVDLYRAVSPLNPDGQRGIHTHLDTGIAPETPEDASIYGDWGGYSIVPPVQKEDGTWTGDNPQTAWQTQMIAARRGIFRYILAYPSGGGSNPLNSFAGSGPMNNAWVLAHEFAHAMGLDHGGNPAIAQPNCKPNYQSLLNYGFQGNPEVGFSDGVGTSALNNTSLVEFGAVNPSNTSYLDVLENVYKYYVDRQFGHVDWNRDGVIAAEGWAVRAYANYKPGGGGCEFTRMNSSMIPTAASTVSPSMARLGNRLYVFYSVLGAVYATYSTDAGNCPQADFSACATWSDRVPVYMDAQGGIDVVKAGNTLVIVSIDNNGALWESRLTLDGAGNEQWAGPVQLAGSAAVSEPSLSDVAHCKVLLAYRGADGNVRHNNLNCADGYANWQGEQLSLDQDGNPIAMADYASPGIGRAMIEQPGFGEIYGAFADANGRLDLYRFNDSTNRWDKTSLLDSRPGPIEGRPAIAWTLTGGEFDQQNKLYLMYIRHDTTPGRAYREQTREVRMLTSYVKVDKLADGQEVRTLKVGLEGSFDNVWLYAFGIDLYFEAGVDTNLRSVLSIAINKPEIWAGIQFRPKSDGIVDMTMKDHNDWEILRIGLCKNVANPGGLVSNPIVCPTN